MGGPALVGSYRIEPDSASYKPAERLACRLTYGDGGRELRRSKLVGWLPSKSGKARDP